jgi:hypothetical protein
MRVVRTVWLVKYLVHLPPSSGGEAVGFRPSRHSNVLLQFTLHDDILYDELFY